MELMDIQHRILHPALADWVADLLHASYGHATLWLAAGKGRHEYIPIKMASGVQDITCVFVEVAGSYEKKTLILQCSGIVCSPPVVSKCLGEAHRRLGIIYIIYILFFFFFSRATDQQYGIRSI